MPPRPSAFSLSPHISCLKSLLRLSLCQLSISFLPSEIGSLKKLEELDISFNNLKTLPNSIADLVSLKSLKVARNKLVELPLGISNLSRLTTVDASNNRLTSLRPLELFSMGVLRKLNVQDNKLQGSCRIPPWISCSLEGNTTLGNGIIQCEPVSSSTEEELSACTCKEKGNHSLEAKSEISLPNSSCKHVASAIYSHQSRGKTGWKRRQRKACQESLDSNRKLCTEDYQESENVGNVTESNTVPVQLSKDALYQPQETVEAPDMGLTSLVQNVSNACQDSGDVECKNGREIDPRTPLQRTERKVSPENITGCKLLCSGNSVNTDSSNVISNSKSEVNMNKIPFPALKENGQVDGCPKVKNDALPKTRRRRGVCINNSKPCKRLRSLREFSRVSQKYSNESFCGVHDILADGFYDAGQDRSFKPLKYFENETFCLDTREIILVDRERDEELDAIALSAWQVISGWKRFGQGSFENGYKIDDYQRASLLALFVSNCFGGSDKSLNISTMRRAVVGVNVEMPFVCTLSY